MRRLILPLAGLALFAGGYGLGQHRVPAAVTAAPAAQFYEADYCSVRIRTEYFSGGSYTSVTGVVADWNGSRWNALMSWNALDALGHAGCEQRY